MDFLPGFLQGITRVFISYPFDYVRVHLQTNKYSSIRSFMKSNHFKLFNLYRGVKYPLSIVPMDRAISFKFFEDFTKDKKQNPFIASLMVSSVTCLYSVPLQSINANYILANSKKGYISFVKDIFTNYKRGFVFKSYTTEYSRLVLASTIYMGVYGTLRNNTPNEKKYHMTNGLIANMALWFVTYPLDTIRVEHQTNNLSLLQTVKQKYLTQGIKSFYRGILLVCIRTIPASTLGMLVYESTKKMIH